MVEWKYIVGYYLLIMFMAIQLNMNGEDWISIPGVWAALFVTLFWSFPWLLMLYVRYVLDGEPFKNR